MGTFLPDLSGIVLKILNLRLAVLVILKNEILKLLWYFNILQL